MLKKVAQLIWMLCGGLLGYGLSALLLLIWDESSLSETVILTGWLRSLIKAILILLGVFVFLVWEPRFSKGGKRLAREIEDGIGRLSAPVLMTGTAGLVVGLFVAYLISNLYSGFNVYLQLALSLLTYMFMGYLGTQVAAHRGADMLRGLTESGHLRSIRGSRGSKKNNNSIPKIFDTSVIIDGRITDILNTGFLEGPIIIPEFVLTELQHIADSSDGLKRARGRRGLDVLNKIQTEYGIEIYNTEKEKAVAEIPEVDLKLLKLAQIMDGKVVTNDFNLNKVAGITGVPVLNINELANTLKPVVLPGERMQIFIAKEGKESDQGVAYLDDGTMIVVESGREYIGEAIDATVTSVLQTSAGRMIFAKPVGKKSKSTKE